METQEVNRKPLNFKRILSIIVIFMKKHKVLIIIVLSLLLLCLAITAAYSAIISHQFKSQIEGKIFVQYLKTSDEPEEVFAFQNGYLAHEKWYPEVFGNAPFGDIASFDSKYKVTVDLFYGNLGIYQEDPQRGWISITTVSFDEKFVDENGVHHIGGGSRYWKEATLETVDNLRSMKFCDHVMSSPTITKAATCSTPGEKTLSCQKCNYQEVEQYSIKHNYVDNRCTRCGETKPSEKASFDANTWYTYDDVLYFQNSKVVNAVTVGRGTGMMVTFYSVCQSCRAVDDLIQMAGPEIGYDVERIHTCEECGARTIVKFKIG